MLYLELPAAQRYLLLTGGLMSLGACCVVENICLLARGGRFLVVSSRAVELNRKRLG